MMGAESKWRIPPRLADCSWQSDWSVFPVVRAALCCAGQGTTHRPFVPVHSYARFLMVEQTFGKD